MTDEPTRNTPNSEKKNDPEPQDQNHGSDVTVNGQRYLAIALFMYIQAYYHILRSVTQYGNYAYMLDISLNASYLWVCAEIRRILAHSSIGPDCPVIFEPAIPSILPSDIAECDWDMFFRDQADALLLSAQIYLAEHATTNIDEKSPESILLNKINILLSDVIAEADRYNQRIQQEMRRLFPNSIYDGPAGGKSPLSEGLSHDPTFRSAKWFEEATRGKLNGDRLRKAVIRTKLTRSVKRGVAWHHSVDEVCQLYPDFADMIKATLRSQA